jgi:hypothetical protein
LSARRAALFRKGRGFIGRFVGHVNHPFLRVWRMTIHQSCPEKPQVNLSTIVGEIT